MGLGLRVWGYVAVGVGGPAEDVSEHPFFAKEPPQLRSRV